MDNMISIGTPEESVLAVGKAIVDILKCDQDQATLQKALEALSSSVKVSGVTVSGCTFAGGKSDEETEFWKKLIEKLV